ncbi:hypothetical protein DYBT9275_02852 [Dyadobacter sp. CECT 9275]|uniref:Uncharacterized protein n=2 Tax=Dyadobacter helix TaxID=2822344 RepID=A0A916JGG9_9BACT|nr:hypothetical protein DYBT9275_02852 [Dyadobacter sp. CECT 9275]
MILIVGCNSKSCNLDKIAGTLGAFQKWSFAISEMQMEKGIENLYTQNPNCRIPEKWVHLDDWKQGGYGFLNGKIFYFEDQPEEMYFVSYYEGSMDSQDVLVISVRAVNNGSSWSTVDDFRFREPEQKRIDNRFHEEIIKKLEKLLNVKAQKYKP